jgi:N-acetylneuraminate synthase
METVDMLDPHVPAHKIGSGDITWPEILRHIASKGKPVFLATGASTIGDVQRAVHTIVEVNRDLVLMQCNTNYTASLANFAYIHLNVLKTYAAMFPDVVLGLSDHTPGHATVLGAVALGARAVEKHFTDDNSREGPDHPFSMTPASWRDMVDRTRELEQALGSADKDVVDNERDTVVVQRRCVRAAHELAAGQVLTRRDLEVLRPAPADAIFPYEIDAVLGMKPAVDVASGEALRWSMLVAA